MSFLHIISFYETCPQPDRGAEIHHCKGVLYTSLFMALHHVQKELIFSVKAITLEDGSLLNKKGN
ncbi:unnamed protein product [marine sediment metagenome]|uniref:Uncharacterized protein n=1 Tax=marine sediment metagenome TaxID=412755 RepID=X1R4M9_9ZZZZ